MHDPFYKTQRVSHSFLWADQWQGRNVPNWAMQPIAMAVAAPFATFLVYWVTSGGLQGFIATPPADVDFLLQTIAQQLKARASPQTRLSFIKGIGQQQLKGACRAVAH